MLKKKVFYRHWRPKKNLKQGNDVSQSVFEKIMLATNTLPEHQSGGRKKSCLWICTVQKDFLQ